MAIWFLTKKKVVLQVSKDDEVVLRVSSHCLFIENQVSDIPVSVVWLKEKKK